MLFRSILVNNNGGPPAKDFRQLSTSDLAKGVEANMITPIALIQAVIDGMSQRKFGRIINITSGSVKAPLPNLDLSSGARAGLTAFIAGLIRSLEAFEVEQILGAPSGIFVYSTRIYDLVNNEPPKFAQAMALSTMFVVLLAVLATVYQV